jgi:hypothetical protein
LIVLASGFGAALDIGSSVESVEICDSRGLDAAGKVSHISTHQTDGLRIRAAATVPRATATQEALMWLLFAIFAPLILAMALAAILEEI